MPTYEYRCKQCNHEFDEFQSISADSLVICPSCQHKSLIRIIGGGSGLIFKGSGFYLTDYKKSNTSPAGGNSNTVKPEEKSKAEARNTSSAESSATKSSSDT